MDRRNFIQMSIYPASLFAGWRYSFGAENPFRESDNPVVINAGIGGNNTYDILARIEQDCLMHHPELTILMAGTNDCMNSRHLVPLSQYEQNMRTIISRIADNKSRMILMSILPAYEPYLNLRHDPKSYEPLGHTEWKSAVNGLIKKLSMEYRQIFLDMHHIFDTSGNVGEKPESWLQNEANSGVKDGVHPTPEGYRAMAVSIYECIIRNELPRRKIVCLGDSITAGLYPEYLKQML